MTRNSLYRWTIDPDDEPDPDEYDEDEDEDEDDEDDEDEDDGGEKWYVGKPPDAWRGRWPGCIQIQAGA